ncbi:MAG: MFS transporter [Microthrixaceae bacterium]
MIDRGAPPARLGDPEHRLLLVGLVCLVTLVATEAMAISTVMPAVEDDLGDLWLYGWVFSAFYLGNLVGVVVGGRAVDRVAPVGPMAVGVSVFLVGLVVGGLAPSMSVLVAGRLLQGVGAGVVPAVSYVCVGRGFPEMLRPKVFAVMSTAWVVPSLVSPLLASFVADHLGWRWVFLGLVPVTVVVSVLAVPALRTVAPAPVGERARSEATAIRSVLVLVLGSGLLVGGLSLEAPIVGVPIAVLGSFVLVPAFRALTPPGTLRAGRGLAATVLSRGLLTWAFFSADAFVSLAMTSVRSASTRDAGFVLAGSSLMWTAGSWLQARTYAEWGPRRLVRLGACCRSWPVVS